MEDFGELPERDQRQFEGHRTFWAFEAHADASSAGRQENSGVHAEAADVGSYLYQDGGVGQWQNGIFGVSWHGVSLGAGILCAVHMNGFPGRQSQVRSRRVANRFLLRARRSRDALDHHDEEHFAAVPPSQPAHSPTVNAVTQGDGPTQTEIARLHSQVLNWTRRFGGQNGGLGRDIDGKVLGAHPDVDAGMMAGDRCIHLLWWRGKGKDFFAHVMTHPTLGAALQR